MSVVEHAITLRPHLWQQRFFWSKSRYVGIIAGIRGGKTVIGSLIGMSFITVSLRAFSPWTRRSTRCSKSALELPS